ncbi:MAG: exodeoxyribonuclease VII small subunit [Porticoccaceae bacterium]
MATKKAQVKETPLFEEQLAKLEALVESLEEGELSLEQSMLSFEQGISLARECQKALSEAEQKVAVLTRDGDQLNSQPFELDED